MKTKLIQICSKHTLRGGLRAVVREPYIPLVPKAWNRLLVLAEAQNLSDSSSDYVANLARCPPTGRIDRLAPALDDVGVEPWDDGSLKIAVHTALGESPDDTAVSNAVLWSVATRKGTNARPSDELRSKSVEVWLEMLDVLNPMHVLTAGVMARDIVTKCRVELQAVWRHSAVLLPSPSLLSRVAGIFDENDLFLRYPEVARTTKTHPAWFGSYRKNKILFACHAVSILGGASA